MSTPGEHGAPSDEFERELELALRLLRSFASLDETSLAGLVAVAPTDSERFDVIFCFGILHRVENPLGLLRVLGGLLAPGGRLLVETYGIAGDGRAAARTIEVQQPGRVYAGDDCVYWGSGAGGLSALATLAGFAAREERRHADDRRAPAHSRHTRAPAVDEAASGAAAADACACG